MCSFQILKPSEKKAKYQYGGMNTGRPVTPPRTAALTTGGAGGMSGAGGLNSGLSGTGVGAVGNAGIMGSGMNSGLNQANKGKK